MLTRSHAPAGGTRTDLGPTAHRHSPCRAPRRSPAAQVAVVVDGELDLATVPELRGRLAAALRQRPDRLVVDLSGCTFADCTALTLLLQVQRGARRQGTDLVLQQPSRPVRRLLELTGLSHVLPVEAAA